ncbi:hypothetical protein HU200_067695 [Digitaria exilis]|uniref:Nucleotide-diphospho-sugar transferase domain-containing protein n=1 Tax=Digitaria exilis TaxID=1010633 RepID=A0A834ZZW2_9POAL|nr:hypothetical protein HU200_067695 [Digitaria exilis]
MYSYSIRDIQGFLAGLAVAAATILLLLPPCPCPGTVMSSYHGDALLLGNATQQADPSNKKPALSFHLGVRTEPLLNHLVIVAVDARAYERCQQVHPLCYALAVDVDYASEQAYMANHYVDMMWRRNRFQARVLDLGYSFVFTDVDIVWLRNPLLRIPVGADIAVSCDYFYGDNPYDLNKTANGGFVYARAGPRTVAFYGDWYAAREAYPGEHEQFVFDQVKHALSERHGVRAQFVDTAYLSGFCELRKDFYKVCTVHANCVAGLQDKLQKLAGVIDEWKEFRDMAAQLGSNSTALTD